MTAFYETEKTTLYNGDCVKVMQEMLSVMGGGIVNKVITSPPYNIIRPNSTDRGYDEYKDGMTNEQYIAWVLEIFSLYDKLLAKNGCILWNQSYGTENTEAMNLTIAEIIKNTAFTLADIIVWKKQMATPNNVSANKMTRICEFVYVFCRREEFDTFTANKRIVGYRDDTNQAIYENLFNFFEAENNDASTDLNKATFSSEFVNNLIDRYVLADDLVLDNFNGTGTTTSACLSRGIKSIGIELSKAQCEYAKNRICNVQFSFDEAFFS